MAKPIRLWKETQEPTTMDKLKALTGVVKETVAERLTLSTIFSEVVSESVGMFNHGRTELAAALFNGSAFVMYMKGQEEVDQTPLHGLPADAAKEQDRGMEM